MNHFNTTKFETSTRPDTRPISSRWRVGRGSIQMGSDSNTGWQGLYFGWAGADYAQKSLIRPISRHPKFCVTDRPSDPLKELLSQKLKSSLLNSVMLVFTSHSSNAAAASTVATAATEAASLDTAVAVVVVVVVAVVVNVIDVVVVVVIVVVVVTDAAVYVAAKVIVDVL